MSSSSRHRRRSTRDALRAAESESTRARAVEAHASQPRADRRPIAYPEALPITARRDELVAAIREHQVIVVAGETGSGKSTQLPKLCLEAGRGVDGHDRPHPAAPGRGPHDRRARRRRARHTDRRGRRVHACASTTASSDATLIRVMTDGILLNELHRDRDLRRYDTLIIDEAHERSLNIDFILGYLKQLLPRRPDLQGDRHVGHDRHRTLRRPLRRRRRHAGTGVRRRGSHVSGRAALPPVRRRRPRRSDRRSRSGAGRDRRRRRARATRAPATCSCSSAASARSTTSPTPCAHDDADTAAAASSRCCRCTPGCRRPSSTGSSSPTAAAGSCCRRTSPRRRSRCPACATWSTPARPGSRGSAGGSRCSGCRSSRCRRRRPTNAPGAAGGSRPASASGSTPRTTSTSRPEFTEPEILRTNLASVILQMTAIGLGDVDRFPFVEPPDQAAIRDGYLLLDELGALTEGPIGAPRQLTVGRPPAGPAAGRPAAGPDGDRGRPPGVRARGARDRLGAVDPGRPRAPEGVARAGRRTAPPVRRRGLRSAVDRRPVGLPARAAARSCPATSSGGCAATSTSTTCVCASGATSTASCARSPASSACGPASRPPIPITSTGPCSPGCCRTSACATARAASSAAPATRGS